MVTRFQVLFGILVFMVGFFDGVDGAVARGGGRSSNTGAFTVTNFLDSDGNESEYADGNYITESVEDHIKRITH